MTIESVPPLDFDWTAPGALGRNYLPRLLEIQAREPLFWSEYQQAWVVTRHADIMAGLKDPRFSNSRYHLELELHAAESGSATLDTVRRWVFNLDGRAHMRLRTLLMKPFARAQAERNRDAIALIVASYLDRLETRDSFDFAAEFAGPFVAESLLHMVGFTDVISPQRLIAMANAIIAALVTAGNLASVQQADRAIEELTPIIEAQIAERRINPRDDLLTSLIDISESGDRLSIEDIISLFHVLMLAAIDTTANTLSLMMPVLDEAPERRDHVRTHPEQSIQIVEELQRFIGMQNMIHRIVAEECEWHGKRLMPGQIIMFMLAAGNWDPREFDRPTKLDFDRKRNQPLSFAPGLHHCVGVHIAKMELEEALKALFERYDRVRVLEEPTYQPNYMARCFHKLMVRLEPRG